MPATGTIRVTCVCLGNICRSPMAAAILRSQARARGVPLTVRSAGTASWHVGKPAHPETAAQLAAPGIDATHRARQFRQEDFPRTDLVLAMDLRNADDLRALAPTPQDRAKVVRIRDFDPARPRDRDVPDPYGGGPEDYARVFRMLEAACGGLLDRIHGSDPPSSALPG